MNGRIAKILRGRGTPRSREQRRAMVGGFTPHFSPVTTHPVKYAGPLDKDGNPTVRLGKTVNPITLSGDNPRRLYKQAKKLYRKILRGAEVSFG